MNESRPERAAHRATDLVRSALRRMARRLGPLRRIPVELRIGGAVLGFFLVSFAAAVVPLLTTGGKDPRAEVAWQVGGTPRVGQDYALSIGVDNTSGAVIGPLCIIERSSPGDAVVATRAVFQGLETVAFSDGRACGGSLSGQETINVLVTLSPRRAGPMTLTLVAGQGDHEIGPPVSRTLTVAAA